MADTTESLKSEVSRLREALVQAERSLQIERTNRGGSNSNSSSSPGGDSTSADLQVKLAAAFTKISSLEREVDTKQRLLEDAASETERVRDDLERVVKELVARNNSLGAELRKINDQHDREISEVLQAHERTVAELTDCRRQLSILREAQSTSTAQIATNASINRELAEECETHRQRRQAAEAALHETQRAMEELRLSESDARADVDELLGKLQRADSHLLQLTEEATAASITASRLKAHAQQLQSERDTLSRKHDELISRIKTPSIALTDLIRNLMRDVDAALRDAQNIMQQKHNNNHRSSTPSWFDDSNSDHHHNHNHNSVPRLWPSNSELDDASCIVLALQRASEVVPVLTDDIAAVRRSITESLRRETDEVQQLDVLKDALNAERSHVAELAESARGTAEQTKRQEEEIVRLNSALQDSAQWMAEAAQIGEERARRAESLALTIRSLENERNQLMTEVTRLREELQHAKLLNEVSSGSLAGANLINNNNGSNNSSSSHHNNNYHQYQGYLSSSSATTGNQSAPQHGAYYSPSHSVRNLASSSYTASAPPPSNSSYSQQQSHQQMHPSFTATTSSSSGGINNNINGIRGGNTTSSSWENTFAAARQSTASKHQQQQQQQLRR